MKCKLEGVPEDLAPGTYATRVKEASWQEGELVVVLVYAGPLLPKQKSLFTITKGYE